MSAALRVEREPGLARVTLDRPPLNLLEPSLIEALRATFVELAGDPDVRVGVLTGAGRAFTAGMDLRVLGGLDAGGARALITALHEAIESIHHAPFPVIAAVNGPCLGAGFELALACDLRVAAEHATFGLPEVRVGVPSVIEAALLPALVGLGRAGEMLLTGDRVDAARALEWGLVNRVVPAADLGAVAHEVAGRILTAGPRAVRLQKALMLRWRYSDLASAIRAGIAAFVAAYEGDEPAEGAAAFLARRPPRFGPRR
jgi:enoyl-CoA hydratase/carnithine racemase